MNRDLALAVLRALAVDGSQSLDGLRGFSDRDWHRTFAWLDDSGLALELLALTERASATDVLPRWVAEDLRVRLTNNRQRLSQMKREFDTLNCALEQAGVEFAVLKGFSLTPAYVPHVDLRSQYDYDYLVAPRSFETAEQVLETTGLRRRNSNEESPSAALFAADAFDCSAQGEEWYGPRIPRRVELHFRLWAHDREAIHLQTPNDALERKIYATRVGMRFPVLADEDALIFQCLHAFHHILDYWCRPSCFLEIARFLNGRSADKGFWSSIRSRIDGHQHLHEIAAFVFRLASGLFQASIPAGFALDETSRRSRALDLWVRRYGLDWCLACFPGSKLSLFVHREFVDNREWSKVLRDRLLPVHRPAVVAEARSPDLRSNLRVAWQQCWFGMARVRHHVAGLAAYTWNLRGWHESLNAARLDAARLRIPEKPRSRQGMREA